MPLLKWRPKRRKPEKFAKLPDDPAPKTTSIDHLNVCDVSSTTTSEQASVNESVSCAPPKLDVLKGSGSLDECPSKTLQVSENLAWRDSNGDSRQNVAIQPETKPKFTPERQRTCENVIPADEWSDDLWERAYEGLRRSKEGGEQMQKYEAILQANMEGKADIDKTSIGDHGPDRLTQMSALAIDKMQAIDDSRWKFQLGERSVELKKMLEHTVKAIVFAKDFVSSAASNEPHAALAWAGVSMLLPLLLNPTSQRESLAKGIEYMSSLIVRFTIIERTYKQPQSRMQYHLTPDREAFHTAFESHIIKLYAQILGFQAKAVCQLYKPSLQRHALDTIKVNDWGAMVSEIKEEEMECQKYFDIIGSANLDDAFKEQHVHVEKLFQAWNVEKRRDRDDEAQRHQSKDESKALRALCTTTYRDHKNRNPDRVKNTCRWFLESAIYCSWRSTTGSGMLWVTADPGCGKSVLSKSLIDEELQSTTQMTTIYFFFKDDSAERRSAVHALCALLHQLCISKPILLGRLAEAYRRNGSTLMLSFSWLWDLFMELTEDRQTGEVVCVLDALDECRLEERRILIDHLNDFHFKEQSNRKLRFLITSRPYLDIEERFDKVVIRLAAEEASELISQEIDLVIRASVARIAIRKQLDQNTKTLLEDRLLKTKNRTYLWLHLAIDSIEKASSVGTLRRMAKLIDEIPNSVYQAYESILSRSADRVEATELLHIVLAAMRPLSLREMNLALNLKSGQASVDDIDLYPQAQFERHIRNLCGLFINVYEEEDYDHRIVTDREHLRKLHLIHQTAREFLLERDITGDTASCTMRASCGQEKSLIVKNVTDPKQQPYGIYRVSAVEPPLWQHSMQIRQAHLLLAHKCMSYLILECADDKRLARYLDMRGLFQELGFLMYTVLYWYRHFTLSKDTKILLELWHRICGGMITRNLLGKSASPRRLIFRNLAGKSAFHGRLVQECPIILDGCTITVEEKYITVKENYVRVEEKYMTVTELMWAICIRHEALVASLIEETTDLDERDGQGYTALFWAVRCGSPAIVNMLLANRVSVNIRDCDCMPMPEYVASVWLPRYFPIFRISRSRRGWTPLHTAVHCMMDEGMRCTIIRLLLEAGADPNMEDNKLQKPLHICMKGSHAAVAILKPLTSFKLRSLRLAQKLVWVATFLIYVIASQMGLQLPWHLVLSIALPYCISFFCYIYGLSFCEQIRDQSLQRLENLI